MPTPPRPPAEEPGNAPPSCVDPERTARERLESYVRQGLWRQDPAITEARKLPASPEPSIIRVDFSDDAYAQLRPRLYPDIADRLLVCGRDDMGSWRLSVLRSSRNTRFNEDAIERVAGAAQMLVSVVAKHVEMRRSRPNVALALTALEDIELCIDMTALLPRREAEVCARILYGLSSVGIALDLNVSEETVKTYRKRAYRRLNIGSERELLPWYLTIWGAWQRPVMVASARHDHAGLH